ncbi:TapB family protein [Hymenobacter weizhouensis]|uniref:TapB family protein n=1 Tax=Hymenobacter sp. YIM 151500-1 TaxID=2987689 RepID=UPI002227D50E|nr:hypothetical protein [Hymenobacter sp. YIM 151500-1]UYZ64227.1 hypothetical protein OIS53_05110 [Hymenobacter sp. YIM 151500-1]
MLRSSLLGLLALVLVPGGAWAQQPAAAAPSTPTPFGLHDDTELVYELQDGKGRRTGTLRQRVVHFGEEQNKKKTVTTTTALLKSGQYDARDRLLNMQDLTFRCRQDTSFTDGASELPQERLRSFRDRLFTYSPVPLAWPNQPTVGSTLPSGGTSVQVSSTAVDIARVYATVRNRRVAGGPAPLATPAGTFSCYQVEAQHETGTVARTDMTMRTAVRVVDYYSPTVGLVKSEVYDKNGKLERVRVLTAVNRTGNPAPAPVGSQSNRP